MIRFFFRALGSMILLGALGALIMDALATYEAEEFILASLGQRWTEYAAVSLNQFQFALQEHLGLIWLWDEVILWILNQPTFAVLGVLGVVTYLLGRKPPRRGHLT